jgi:hypothetical protein
MVYRSSALEILNQNQAAVLARTILTQNVGKQFRGFFFVYQHIFAVVHIMWIFIQFSELEFENDNTVKIPSNEVTSSCDIKFVRSLRSFYVILPGLFVEILNF